MKRIILAVSNDLSYDQRMQRICLSLTKQFEVLLIGRKLKNSVPLKKEPFKQKRLRLIFNKGKLFYFELNLRMFFSMLFRKSDILCANDLDTILSVRTAAILRSKTTVFDAHEYFTEVPELYKRKLEKSLWKLIGRICIPQMTLCYTVSESLADIFSQEYKSTFHVIRNLPYYNGSAAEKKTSGKFILYQGALNDGRGLEELILSLHYLSLNLVVAGEGDLSETLRKMVSDQNLEPRVEFKGRLAPDKLKELTNEAFVGYNLLAEKGKSYYYSLSNKFFDYIHAGIPSLSPDFPEYRRINNLYKVGLLSSLSVENIVIGIKKLISDENYYKELQANCIRAAAELNWQNEEKKLLSLYHEL